MRDQLVNLTRVDTIANAFAAGKNLTLHGWVYDIRDGLLKPLMKINRTTDLDDLGRPERVLLDDRGAGGRVGSLISRRHPRGGGDAACLRARRGKAHAVGPR